MKNLGKEFVKQIIANAPAIIAEEIKKIDVEEEIKKFQDMWNTRKDKNTNSNNDIAVIFETDENGIYEIKCNMIGISKKNVDVQLSPEGVLNIVGKQDDNSFNYCIEIGDAEILRTELKLGILNFKIQQKKVKKSQKINVL